MIFLRKVLFWKTTHPCFSAQTLNSYNYLRNSCEFNDSHDIVYQSSHITTTTKATPNALHRLATRTEDRAADDDGGDGDGDVLCPPATLTFLPSQHPFSGAVRPLVDCRPCTALGRRLERGGWFLAVVVCLFLPWGGCWAMVMKRLFFKAD